MLIKIWHVSWHVSEPQSRASPAFTVFVNMALSKKGQRTSQKKGTACFDMGLNFPEKHANYIYNVLFFFQQKYFSSISSLRH